MDKKFITAVIVCVVALTAVASGTYFIGQKGRDNVVNRQALHDFYNTDMETLRYNCLMAENLYEMVYSRLLESYCKTPEERYRRLTTRYPKIEQEIPLCKIASFLNVTPETISHIRNKIVKNS